MKTRDDQGENVIVLEEGDQLRFTTPIADGRTCLYANVNKGNLDMQFPVGSVVTPEKITLKLPE